MCNTDDIDDEVKAKIDAMFFKFYDTNKEKPEFKSFLEAILLEARKVRGDAMSEELKAKIRLIPIEDLIRKAVPDLERYRSMSTEELLDMMVFSDNPVDYFCCKQVLREQMKDINNAVNAASLAWITYS